MINTLKNLMTVALVSLPLLAVAQPSTPSADAAPVTKKVKSYADENDLPVRQIPGARTILVVPAGNPDGNLLANFTLNNAIYHALVERGYYVYPAGVVKELLLAYGMPDINEAYRYPPEKYAKDFNADYVIKVIFEDFKFGRGGDTKAKILYTFYDKNGNDLGHARDSVYIGSVDSLKPDLLLWVEGNYKDPTNTMPVAMGILANRLAHKLDKGPEWGQAQLKSEPKTEPTFTQPPTEKPSGH